MPLSGTPREKIRQVLHEFKNRELRSGSKRGPRVTDRRQAVAIASDVRAECRERYGDTPCILIVRSDGLPSEAHDCADWCPLLRLSIEDACHQKMMPIQRTLSP